MALDDLGDGKEGARVQPARDVVARGVHEERVVGDVEDMSLERLEVTQAHDFAPRAGLAYDEVAKAEVGHDGLAQVDGQFLGVFVEKYGAHGLDGGAVCRLRRLDDERQIRVALAQIAGEPQAGGGVFYPLAVKGYVAYHAQQIGAVLLVERHGLLIVAGEHHLGAAAHAQHLLVLVEGLGREFPRLLEQKLVDMRQYRRVKSHRVLDHHYHLHAHLGDVGRVEAVFHQLDDGQQQVHITQPAEYVVDGAEVGLGQSSRHFL